MPRTRALILLLALLGASPALAERTVPEYQLKAAFLYNFALFTDWPGGDAGTLPVCIYGPDPFGGALDTLAGKQVHGRALSVQRPATLAELKGCRVLFIGAAERANMARIGEAVRGAPVLTVGDGESFTSRGAMIALGVDDSRVVFDVNAQAVRESGLALSSKLLRLARCVEGGSP
jgi:hypothetical protein